MIRHKFFQILKIIFAGIFFFILSWILLIIVSGTPLNGVIATLDSYFYLLFFQPTELHKDILVLDEVNERYERADYARLIDGIARNGASVIALDVMFEVDYAYEKSDSLIAVCNRYQDRIVHAFELTQNDNNYSLSHLGLMQSEDLPHSDIILQGESISLPFDSLLNVIKHIACISSKTDIANKSEQYYPLLVEHDETIYPSLALLASMLHLSRSSNNFHLESLNQDSLVFSANGKYHKIPLNGQTRSLINFVDDSKKKSIEDALKEIENSTQDRLKEMFGNKIVLIGSSLETSEQTMGPQFKSYPSLFVHASVISQILNKDFIIEDFFLEVFIALILTLISLIWYFYTLSRPRPFLYGHLYWISIAVILIITYFAIPEGIKLHPLLIYGSFCITFSLTLWYANKVLHMKPLTVFISYSHRDKTFVTQLKKAIEKKRIYTQIDTDTMCFGDNVEDYIKESIRDTDFTIGVISENSLKSIWVVEEAVRTLNHQLVEGRMKYLPVFIDRSFFSNNFQKNLVEEIDTEIERIIDEISILNEKKTSTIKLDKKKNRLIDLRSNIDKLLNQLDESLIVDMSTDEKFEENMPKLIKMINKIKLQIKG